MRPQGHGSRIIVLCFRRVFVCFFRPSFGFFLPQSQYSSTAGFPFLFATLPFLFATLPFLFAIYFAPLFIYMATKRGNATGLINPIVPILDHDCIVAINVRGLQGQPQFEELNQPGLLFP